MNQKEYNNFIDRFQYNVRKDKLGGGPLASVFKAYDNAKDRFVAIKVSEVKHVNNKEFSLKKLSKELHRFRHIKI